MKGRKRYGSQARSRSAQERRARGAGSAASLGSRHPGPGSHAGGLRGARGFPAAPRLPPGPGPPRPRALGIGRPAHVRPAQHPLPLRHGDRRVGARQAHSLFAPLRQRRAVEVRDGQQVMLEARMIKSADEIVLLNMAAAMGDGVYQDIFEALKPGVRENEIVALATKRLYEMGSDCVEAINAISGERCSPHPHNFTDRMLRPGDQAFFDIIQSFVGYRTCYYRTFSVGRATRAQVAAYKKAATWARVARPTLNVR